jgi:two-component system, NarL family, sensor kinase
LSDTGVAVWWVFLAGVLALTVILVGFIVALVISQRRVLRVERDHARRLLEAQEAERAWVAREVHDDALQRVMVVRSELELLLADTQARDRPDDARKLAAVTTELDDLSYLLRTVAHRLHPSMLEQAGLVAGLRSLAGEMGRSLGLRVTLDAPDGAIPLKPDVALAGGRFELVSQPGQGTRIEVGFPLAEG